MKYSFSFKLFMIKLFTVILSHRTERNHFKIVQNKIYELIHPIQQQFTNFFSTINFEEKKNQLRENVLCKCVSARTTDLTHFLPTSCPTPTNQNTHLTFP